MSACHPQGHAAARWILVMVVLGISMLDLAFSFGTITSNNSTNETTTLNTSDTVRIWCLKNPLFADNSSCESTDLTCMLGFINKTNDQLNCRGQPGYKEVTRQDLIALADILFTTCSNINRPPLSSMLDSMPTDYKHQPIVMSNIAMQCGVHLKITDMTFPNYYDHTFFPNENWMNRTDSILLPYVSQLTDKFFYSWLLLDGIPDSDISVKEVIMSSFGGIKSVQDIDTSLYDPSTDPTYVPIDDYVFNTELIGLTVNTYENQELPDNITITLQQTKKGYYKAVCLRWIRKSRRNVFEFWTSFGVSLVYANSTHVVCTASSFSIFAAIMKKIPPKLEKVLSVYNYIAISALGLSVVIQLLFIILVHAIRCNNYAYTKNFVNLSGALLLYHLVLIPAINLTDSSKFCSKLITATQYFCAAVFSWLMVDCLHLLSVLANLFNPRTDTRLFFMCFGWGYPLLMTVALIGFPISNSLQLCWVRSDDMYNIWFFAGPLMFPVLISFTCQTISFFTLKSYRRKKKVSRDICSDRVRRNLRTALVVYPTLIGGWVALTLGVYKDNTDLYIVASVVLNLISSIWIFMMHFTLNDEVQDALTEQKKIMLKIKIMNYDHLMSRVMPWIYVDRSDAAKNAYESPGDALECMETEPQYVMSNNMEKNSDKDRLIPVGLVSMEALNVISNPAPRVQKEAVLRPYSTKSVVRPSASAIRSRKTRPQQELSGSEGFVQEKAAILLEMENMTPACANEEPGLLVFDESETCFEARPVASSPTGHPQSKFEPEVA